jgi:hypothetical protein
VKGSRPWRAAAWLPLGPLRLYRASTSARTEAGLDAFRARWEADGCVVTTWEVLPVPELADAGQVVDSTAG